MEAAAFVVEAFVVDREDEGEEPDVDEIEALEEVRREPEEEELLKLEE